MEPAPHTSPRKIVFVITKSNWGGAQRYVYDLATSLKPEEFEAQVVAGGNGLLATKLQEAGVAVTTLDSMQRDVDIKKEFASAWELFRIFRKTKPDIVHLNSSKAGALGALVARIAGVKHIVFTAHAWAFNENRGLISKLMISVAHWITVVLSHHTIAVSESVKEQVSHMPFMKKKIEVIHLGMDAFPLMDRNEARKALMPIVQDLPTDVEKETWVGTIAELHPVKGLPYAIDAIALLKEEYPDLKFYIIGEGQQRDMIEKQIIKRKLESQIHLAGFIDNAKAYLPAFDIFVLPSLSEAFGYSLVEAGLAHLPVIASHVGGIPEVVDEAGILVPPRNGRAIADALKKLLTSPEEARRLAEELTQRVNSLFTIEEMYGKTLDVYRKRG